MSLTKKKPKAKELAPSADEVGPTGTRVYKRASVSATGRASAKAKNARLTLPSEQQDIEEQLECAIGTDPREADTESPSALHTS